MPKSKTETAVRGKRRAKLSTQTIPRERLAAEFRHRVREAGLSFTIVAAIVQDAPSQVSRLMSGHIESFSADRLMRMLTRMGATIDIVIYHSRSLARPGRVRVLARKAGSPRSR